jgi:hypothetical protein
MTYGFDRSPQVQSKNIDPVDSAVDSVDSGDPAVDPVEA